jgi:hypothetical protein
MKKIFAFVLTIIMILSLFAACNTVDSNADNTENHSELESNTEKQTEK